MKIILLGPPGCGKGTQASNITYKYSFPHISTGDIFRENIKNKTPLGIKVKEIIDKGFLAPDELTVELVKDRLKKDDCKNDYLLDGFPRNLFQAKALDTFSSPDLVLNIVVDLDKIEKRITGRRVCVDCGSSFHIDFIGKTEQCPSCKGKLIIREDDKVETIRKRLSVYQEQTQPLIDYYKMQNKLCDINGDLTIEGVFQEIVKVLG